MYIYCSLSCSFHSFVCSFLILFLCSCHICVLKPSSVSLNIHSFIIHFLTVLFYIYSEEMFYNLLSQYILTEEELIENGFPRSSPTTPGKVTFKSRKTQTTPSKDRKSLRSNLRKISISSLILSILAYPILSHSIHFMPSFFPSLSHSIHFTSLFFSFFHS